MMMVIYMRIDNLKSIFDTVVYHCYFKVIVRIPNIEEIYFCMYA